MSPVAMQVVSLEETIDVLCELMEGVEFGSILQRVHESARVKIPFRPIEKVYPGEVETPAGYPCAEIVPIRITDEPTATIAALDHELSCQWSVNGDDTIVMHRELLRLLDATRTYCRSMSLQPYAPGTLRTGDVDFGPVTVSRESGKEFLKSASMELFWRANPR